MWTLTILIAFGNVGSNHPPHIVIHSLPGYKTFKECSDAQLLRNELFDEELALDKRIYKPHADKITFKSKCSVSK